MAAKNISKGRVNTNLFQSVKGKFLLMGIMGIIIALVIGLIGMTSINRNAKSSDVVTLVNEISLLQSENNANDAQYQYYIDEKYLNATLENLQKMESSGATLKKRLDFHILLRLMIFLPTWKRIKKIILNYFSFILAEDILLT